MSKRYFGGGVNEFVLRVCLFRGYDSALARILLNGYRVDPGDDNVQDMVPATCPAQITL